MVMQDVQEKSILTSLGDVRVSSDPEAVLSCLGVGSCIALCIYDPESRVAGMAHIVLPHSRGEGKDASEGKTATKYADIAIPHMLEQMRRLGAVRSRMIVKIAGGAQMFTLGSGGTKANNRFNTGDKNVKSVKKILADEVLKINAAHIGGNKGRTVKMYVATGKTIVKTAGGMEEEL